MNWSSDWNKSPVRNSPICVHTKIHAHRQTTTQSFAHVNLHTNVVYTQHTPHNCQTFAFVQRCDCTRSLEHNIALIAAGFRSIQRRTIVCCERVRCFLMLHTICSCVCVCLSLAAMQCIWVFQFAVCVPMSDKHSLAHTEHTQHFHMPEFIVPNAFSGSFYCING